MAWFGKKSGPPDSAAAMSRALILKFQVVTAMATPPPDVMGELMAAWEPAERANFLAEYRKRQTAIEKDLHDAGLWTAMTSSERDFIRALPPEISEQMILDVSWLTESAGCFMWALRYVEALPPYDVQCDVEELQRLPSDGTRELVKSAKLRPSTTISKARDIAELWHWRSRTRQLDESGQAVELPDGVTLPDVIRMAAEKAAADGVFEETIGDDFPVLGKAYRDLSDEEWSLTRSITMERHKALNWLCGYAPGNRWDETPTDT